MGTEAASCSPEKALAAVVIPERGPCILTPLQGLGFSGDMVLSQALLPSYTVTACFLVPKPLSLPHAPHPTPPRNTRTIINTPRTGQQ